MFPSAVGNAHQRVRKAGGEFRRLEAEAAVRKQWRVCRRGSGKGRCCQRGTHEFAEEAHRHESVCFVPLCLDCKPEKSSVWFSAGISCGSRDLAQRTFGKKVLIVFLCPSESSLRPDSSAA